MELDLYPYPEHKSLLNGDLLPCPFCGRKPYIESCDRLINIGCGSCNYHRHFHGLVQSEIETDVIVSTAKDTGEPLEWYDKDAYAKAESKWNERMA